MIFDKAYVDFAHLAELDARGVQWVTRAKDKMKYHPHKNLTTDTERYQGPGSIVLKGKHKGMRVRRVEAWVEVDDEWRVMVFITNNLVCSLCSVCNLYRRRWDIEVFFKQVKQSLKISGFLGHSANAVRWQVYAALLVYVLLHFHAHLSNWGHSFTRLIDCKTCYRSPMASSPLAVLVRQQAITKFWFAKSHPPSHLRFVDEFPVQGLFTSIRYIEQTNEELLRGHDAGCGATHQPAHVAKSRGQCVGLVLMLEKKQTCWRLPLASTIRRPLESTASRADRRRGGESHLRRGWRWRGSQRIGATLRPEL